jgi:SWI/SNF-related matrix-associated actin-dependent regulator of chromatin subfamily A3
MYWGLSFTAVVAASSLHNILRKRSNNKPVFDISVNIIGPESTADDVGTALADSSAYLQHPFFLEARIRYINPQYFYSGVDKTDLRHLIGPPTTNSRSSHVSEGVESVLNSLYDPFGAALSHEDKTVSVTIDERFIRTKLKR